jgi:6-phosphogluconolactonase (cycloisomerase 2 family)
VTGYRAGFGGLHAIGTTSLGLGNTNPPFFTAGPGQVGFTPDGRELLVTTKSHGTVVGFPVRFDGRLGAPIANPATGAVPFAFSFDAFGRLVVVEAGTNSVSTHVVRSNGSLTTLSGPVTDGQQAACWITVAGRYAYVANAGSSTISTFRLGFDGSATSGGSVDLVASPDGRFLYSENGAAGAIDELRINPNGSLTPIGRVTGLAAQVFEGIAAT